MISFPLFLLEARGHYFFFFHIFTVKADGASGGKSHNMVQCHLWLGPPGVFTSHNYPHWDSCNIVITVLVVLPQHWFLWQFPLMSPCFRSNNSLYLPVFPLSGLAVCPVLPSLMGTRRVVYFSIWIVLYSLLGWSGDFQVPYIQNKKPGVLSQFLKCCSNY